MKRQLQPNYPPMMWNMGMQMQNNHMLGIGAQGQQSAMHPSMGMLFGPQTQMAYPAMMPNSAGAPGSLNASSVPFVGPTAPSVMQEGTISESKSAKQLRIETLRKTLPAFKMGGTRVCNNFNQFGARWQFGKEGDKKVMPRKQKHTCIMWVDPEEWNALRLSSLNEFETDCLIYLMFGVKPNTNPQDMKVSYKMELWEMLSTQYGIIVGRNPDRIQKLSPDLSNVKQVALEYAFPCKYVPKPDMYDSEGNLLDAATTPQKAAKGSTVRIEEIDDSESNDDDGGRQPKEKVIAALPSQTPPRKRLKVRSSVQANPRNGKKIEEVQVEDLLDSDLSSEKRGHKSGAPMAPPEPSITVLQPCTGELSAAVLGMKGIGGNPKNSQSVASSSHMLPATAKADLLQIANAAHAQLKKSMLPTVTTQGETSDADDGPSD